MTLAPDTLPLQYEPASVSDLELASDMYDATAVLAMGDGIAASVAEDLRRRRLEAARELVARWERAT